MTRQKASICRARDLSDTKSGFIRRERAIAPAAAPASPVAKRSLKPSAIEGACTESFVIPGRRAAASPEPIDTGLWNLGSGPAAARHPGMTGYFGVFLQS